MNSYFLNTANGNIIQSPITFESSEKTLNSRAPDTDVPAGDCGNNRPLSSLCLASGPPHHRSGYTLDAIFPYARDILSYPDLLEQGLRPHKVREVWLWASEDPNYRVDVTHTFDVKLAALFCHKSQVESYPDLERWMRQHAEELAEGENFELAEAFHRVVMWW